MKTLRKTAPFIGPSVAVMLRLGNYSATAPWKTDAQGKGLWFIRIDPLFTINTILLIVLLTVGSKRVIYPRAVPLPCQQGGQKNCIHTWLAATL